MQEQPFTYNGWIIGKRIPIGVAIGGIATALAVFFPVYAAAFTGLATTITAILQVVVVNKYGITQKPS